MTSPSIGRPRFISLDEARAWHDLSLRQYGGLNGIRDRALLESALGQPQQQFGGEFAYSYPFGIAASYAWFIAKNHPFLDGNKRTALMCCVAFLRMNGWNLVSEHVLGDAIETGEQDKGVAVFLGGCSVSLRFPMAHQLFEIIDYGEATSGSL